MLPPLPDVMLEPIVKLALAEDLGAAGDVTTDALIDADADGRWAIRAREDGVVAGLDVATFAGWMVDPDIQYQIAVPEGAVVRAGETIMEIEGAVRSVLTAERTKLNFIGRLSGVATLTRLYVDAVDGMGVIIASTRKTTPGLRALEKRAVRLGGGGAHRYGLNDAMLIKDNHIAAAGGVVQAMQRARQAASHLTAIEIEVDSLEQLK
jgi:nicotinate-nucleotide pyrophosphorylase (carboxylating)